MKDINVSVIVPVYKVPLEYLRACLDSLVAQTLQECEFIIVSDGAPEAECSICEEYTKKDSRFKFFKRKHAGVSAARNYGIKQALGEYLSFVDSDDWIEASMAQECYTFANKQKTDILTMDFFVNVNKKKYLRKQKPKSLTPSTILRQILNADILGSVWLRIIRKDFYDKHPTAFPEHVGYCEDVLFWANFFQQQPKINYLPKAFYHYVQDNNDSITRNYTIEKYIEQKKFIYELKKILPSCFKTDINMAAFNVKMEALRNGYLTYSDFTLFEPTSLRTLLCSKQPWILNMYFIIRFYFKKLQHTIISKIV
ncbi:glycosyltransferase [Fibrobacter sp. UWB12]|uniref:glycosyltransferase family 2 protein n=1 Tax=Fibrobacter sp. UWB12 TaxID=1896203 RepID=UPI000912F0E1|nr:glycosyltransferase [Fibrobacter sp. UWB12]SHK89470.1 Glycosyl transferase family 2 [Fibrobacter sp. UWB12]